MGEAFAILLQLDVLTKALFPLSENTKHVNVTKYFYSSQKTAQAKQLFILFLTMASN